MSLPESAQHSGDAGKYHDLIMQQLRLNEETSNRLEGKMESLANEVRTGNLAISQAHTIAIGAIGERINAQQLNTETRLTQIETQLRGLDGYKTDNKWWISIIFSFIAVGGMLIGLFLKGH
jgi:hypothetical protein